MPAIKHRDLMAACLWAVATLLAVLFVEDALVRAIVSAPLLFFLTGHVVLRAIGFVGLSLPEHIAYAVGASIAVCLAGGFFLNWVGCLTPLGWAIWLAAATGSATLIALCRKKWPAPILWSVQLPNFRIWHAAVFCVAAFVTYGAYALAVRDEARQRQFKYTEFWMLSGTPAATSGSLVIGIKSAEAEPRRFDVEVRLDGTTVALWRSIAVEPGATWTRQMAVTPGAGRLHKAEALLYEPASNAVYRKVSAIVPGA